VIHLLRDLALDLMHRGCIQPPPSPSPNLGEGRKRMPLQPDAMCTFDPTPSPKIGEGWEVIDAA